MNGRTTINGSSAMGNSKGLGKRKPKQMTQRRDMQFEEGSLTWQAMLNNITRKMLAYGPGYEVKPLHTVQVQPGLMGLRIIDYQKPPVNTYQFANSGKFEGVLTKLQKRIAEGEHEQFSFRHDMYFPGIFKRMMLQKAIAHAMEYDLVGPDNIVIYSPGGMIEEGTALREEMVRQWQERLELREQYQEPIGDFISDEGLSLIYDPIIGVRYGKI